MFKSLIWSLSESIGRLNANNGLNVDPLLTSKLQGMEGSNLQEVKKNDQFFRGDCIWSFYFKDQNQINSSTPRPLLRANSETALFQVKRNSGNFRYQNEELMHWRVYRWRTYHWRATTNTFEGSFAEGPYLLLTCVTELRPKKDLTPLKDMPNWRF